VTVAVVADAMLAPANTLVALLGSVLVTVLGAGITVLARVLRRRRALG
jgi:hypothetical protein